MAFGESAARSRLVPRTPLVLARRPVRCLRSALHSRPAAHAPADHGPLRNLLHHRQASHCMVKETLTPAQAAPCLLTRRRLREGEDCAKRARRPRTYCSAWPRCWRTRSGTGAGAGRSGRWWRRSTPVRRRTPHGSGPASCLEQPRHEAVHERLARGQRPLLFGDDAADVGDPLGVRAL
jgi:hypothetical protein